MRSFFLLFLFIPVFGFSQVKKNTSAKPKFQAPAFDGYIITGIVTGFPDGTPVSFLNEQTNTPEQQAVVTKGKFIIKGKISQPGFKGLIFNNAQPLVPLFLDNSTIKITGSKDSLDKLVITGSPSHSQFKIYTDAIKPYEQVFSPEASYDSVAISKVAIISEEFVKK